MNPLTVEEEFVSNALLHQVMIEGNPIILVQEAEKIGKKVARQVTTSQIRAIFGTVKKIAIYWESNPDIAKRQLLLLKPKMAYRVAREKNNNQFRALVSLLTRCIDSIFSTPDNIETKKRFSYFVDFFEAILAYHKVFGGI